MVFFLNMVMGSLFGFLILAILVAIQLEKENWKEAKKGVRNNCSFNVKLSREELERELDRDRK